MDRQSKYLKSRTAIIVIVLWIVGLSCSFLSGCMPPTIPISQSSPPTVTGPTIPIGQNSTPAVIQPTIPIAQSSTPTIVLPTLSNGWKVSRDATGKCQAATPPDWQIGHDFFLEAESVNPGPFMSTPGQFPPMGLALWGSDKVTQMPEGNQFQIRTSLVSGDVVCSLWRIKEATDFTDAEKATLVQAGKTLQEVP
jgi:hypothetical protein